MSHRCGAAPWGCSALPSGQLSERHTSPSPSSPPACVAPQTHASTSAARSARLTNWGMDSGTVMVWSFHHFSKHRQKYTGVKLFHNKTNRWAGGFVTDRKHKLHEQSRFHPQSFSLDYIFEMSIWGAATFSGFYVQTPQDPKRFLRTKTYPTPTKVNMVHKQKILNTLDYSPLFSIDFSQGRLYSFISSAWQIIGCHLPFVNELYKIRRKGQEGRPHPPEVTPLGNTIKRSLLPRRVELSFNLERLQHMYIPFISLDLFLTATINVPVPQYFLQLFHFILWEVIIIANLLSETCNVSEINLEWNVFLQHLTFSIIRYFMFCKRTSETLNACVRYRII